MPKTKFLSVKNEVHVELALGAMAAMPTLDRVVDYMRDAHGITTTPAILEGVQRRERTHFEEIRRELAPRQEERLTGDLLDNAAYATEIEHKAIERTEAMLAKSGSPRGQLATWPTAAGRGRRVKIRGALRDELTSARARVRGKADGYVFPTRTKGPTKADNFRNRVLAAAVKRANERLAEDELPPLPGKLTPHSLRRTFASVLYALGEDPGIVMDEMGHTTPSLALRVYRQAMRRDEGEKAALRGLVEGSELAANGSTDEIGGPKALERTAKTPIESGIRRSSSAGRAPVL